MNLQNSMALLNRIHHPAGVAYVPVSRSPNRKRRIAFDHLLLEMRWEPLGGTNGMGALADSAWLVNSPKQVSTEKRVLESERGGSKGNRQLAIEEEKLHHLCRLTTIADICFTVALGVQGCL